MKNNVLKTINHFKIAEEYWLNIFSGEPAEIKMPADFTAPGQYQPGATPVAFGGTLSGKVSTMSSRDHMGAYIILLTAFKIFIFKYTSLNDIIVASPLYNPDNLEYNKFIASRHRIEEGETFKELLMKVKKNVIEGYKHEHFPFDTLSGLLEIDKEVSLFRVAFLFENIHFNTAKKEFIDCLISNYENEITFSVCNTHEELKGELLYNANIFSQESVWRFTRHYLHILQQVLTDVHIKTRDVQWLTKEEKKRLLFDLNDSAAQFPGDKVVHGLFEEQVEKSGDSVALIAGGGNAGENQPLTVDHADIGPPSVPDRERHFTYNQLNEKSNRLAGLLIEKGIGPGAIVALMVERSVELVTGMLAIMKAGGAYLPLDVTDPQTRTRYILADSDVDILLTAKDFSREQDKYSPKNPENTTDSENPMYVIYTSGSTGNPKGVVIRHKGFVNMVYSHKKVFEREPGPRRSQVASPGFDAMAFETWPCLLSGAALYMANNETRMDPCAMKNWLLMTGIMHSFQSTLMAEQLINEPWPRRGVALKVLQTAGDKLTKYPNHSCTFDFYNLYGPTESTVWTTWTKVETKTASSNRTFPVIGKPISNLCIYIMGPGLELKPPGVSGELCVAGEGIAVGYLNQPELTHKKFNHWQGRRIYKTGDLARWLPDGNIEFLGRIDFQVKIRGFRVEPGEIENRLLIHKDVRQAVVVATEVAPGEKCLCAYTIVAKTPAVGELRAYLSKTLPHYMVPSYFVQLESFPLTPSGKVNRKALPPVEIESSRECIPPRDEIEKKLLEIWTGILNVKKELIGIDTDFFQLGGQSLKATLMVAEINRIFQVRIPLLKIFKIPSIRRISEFIKNGNKASKAGEGNDVVLLKEAAAPRPGNIFWIHDGTGEVDGYLEFCNKLQGNLTCWGIRAQRLINFAPQNLSVGDMARTYIDRMKKLQPQGPYYVGSWSIGGIVAFEMVRQLEQAGEKIAFFALIDSPAPPKRWLGRNISITPFSLQAELDMIKDIIPHQRPHPKFRQITHMEQVWPIVIDYLEANGFDGESITKIIQNNGIPPMADNTPPNLENTIYYLNLGRTLKNAWAGYSPGKIDTPIHYFRATDSKERHGKSWKKHASKPIRFYDINGDHYSILKPPGVARFAKFFDEKIAIHSKP